MSAGNAIASGDECYSKGQFDEAINYYTESANQGYVEGMEKLLKTCVEQGRKYRDTADTKNAVAVWSIASVTLKKIMQHNEISTEVKDRSYSYYEEIMHGIANAFIWGSNYETALAALEKLSAEGNVIIEIKKIYCELQICLQTALKIVEEEKQKINPVEAKDKLFPVEDNPRIKKCFERFTILDKLTEKECQNIVKKATRGDIFILSMILYRLIIMWFAGMHDCLRVVERDPKKAYIYWKLRKIIEPNPAVETPQPFVDFFEEYKDVLEDPAADFKSESKLQPKPTPTSAKRKIIINRPKKLMCGLLKVKISVDGVEKAVLKNGESTTLELDGNQHNIYYIAKALDGTVYESRGYIPADDKAHTIEIDVNKRSLLMDEMNQAQVKNTEIRIPEEFEYALQFWVKFCAACDDMNISVVAYTQGPKKGNIELSVFGQQSWSACIVEYLPEAFNYIYGPNGSSNYMTRAFVFYEPDCYIYGCPPEAFEKYDIQDNAENAYVDFYKQYTDNIYISIKFREAKDRHEMFHKFEKYCKWYCYRNM